MTRDEIQIEYRGLCQELGQSVMQHGDLTDGLTSLNARMAEIRLRSKELSRLFAAVDSAILESAVVAPEVLDESGQPV